MTETDKTAPAVDTPLVDTVRPCPVCTHTRARLVHHHPLRTAEHHPVGDGYDVVVCERCGVGYADAAIRQSDYDAIYAETAKYGEAAVTEFGADASAPTDSAWNIERLTRTADLLEELLPGRHARVLDVGCAGGTLLGILTRRGWSDVAGLDPSARSAATAARFHGVYVAVGTFGTVPADLGTFDCVTMTGVLEHVWDVEEAMRAVTALVRPGGIVYVDVPDAARYCDAFAAPFQDFSTEHINHFTSPTLRTLFEAWGFEGVWEGPVMADACGVSHPAIGAAWRLAPAPGHRPGQVTVIHHDDTLVAELTEFAARSNAVVADIDAHLRRALDGHDEIVVWGMGELSNTLLAQTVLGEKRYAALVDGNPCRHGLRYGDAEVSGADAVERTGAPIVIASILSEQSIRADIARRGFPNPVVTLLP